jgi:hypothetical protein
MAVLIEVAYLTFKAHGEPVPIANKALRAVGIDHEAKTRALHRLVMAGALRVIWARPGEEPVGRPPVGLTFAPGAKVQTPNLRAQRAPVPLLFFLSLLFL